MRFNYLATLRDGIPYRKDLRRCVGSVTATILMQQLDFHFFKYPDGFYKFLSSTENHPDYREGDSWTEELAFSEKEFRCAFDHIGVRHVSKSTYLQSPNPFINKEGQEMFYCSYHDKQKGLTWYFRNHELVDLLIEKLLAIAPTKERKRPSVVDSPVAYQRESTVDDHREPCSLPKGSYVTNQRESTFIYKENYKEDNKEKEPPTPLQIDLSFVNIEQPQPQIHTALLTKTETSPQIEKPSTGQIVPARENGSQKTADRVRDVWARTGVLPKIPLELDAWAFADIGESVIKLYRHSGRISTTKIGDIKSEFALYVAGEWKGKDIDYGYDRIRSLEADPRKWETLASLVVKWQASLQTGDRHLNIAREVERSSRPPIKLSL